jgi:hypothetical protein
VDRRELVDELASSGGQPHEPPAAVAGVGAALDQSRALEPVAELNATERAFLDAGIAESERARRAEQRVNRRLRGLLAVGAVLLVVAIAGAVLSLIARSNARTAESAALTASPPPRRRH